MAQETLEQTQRRLAGGLASTGLATGPLPGEAPRLARRGTGGGTVRGLVVLASLIVVGLVAFVVYSGLVRAGVVDDKWTTYPGSAFVPSEAVLADDSLEVLQARSEDVFAEVQSALADYGLVWSVEVEGLTEHGSNGYGGESMLYNYMGPSLVGAADVQDPEAREKITEIFADIVAEHPDVEVFRSNEQFEGAEAENRFGSADRDEQALWEIQGVDTGWVGVTLTLSVFDAGVTTDSDFSTPYWMPSATTATLFVRVTAFAPHVLSENDRAAFIAALEPYAGEAQPAFRG